MRLIDFFLGGGRLRNEDVQPTIIYCSTVKETETVTAYVLKYALEVGNKREFKQLEGVEMVGELKDVGEDGKGWKGVERGGKGRRGAERGGDEIDRCREG
mgnify:CR=1 FL=1